MSEQRAGHFGEQLEPMDEVPAWLLVVIAEQSPKAWLLLTRAAPAVGRYSLNPQVQERMKRRFAKPEIRTYGWEEQRWSILPNGALHGLYETWVLREPGGALYLRRTSMYADGAPSGPYEEYYANGAIGCRGTYISGRLNGPYSTWHANGGLKSRVCYFDGLPVGERKCWDESGRLVSIWTYVGGKIASYKTIE